MSDNANEDFAAFFAEAVKEEKPAQPAAAVEAPAPAAAAPEPAPEPAPDAAEAPAPEAPAPEAPVAEAPAAEAPKPPEISDDELLKRFASLVRQPPAQEQPQPHPQPQREQPQPSAPLFTEDERKALEAYEKDWPDVAKAEAVRRRVELQQAVGYIFEEIAKNFGPVVHGYRELAEAKQVSDLRAQVNDYDQIRDQVVSWVEQQPTFLRPALQNVVANGTRDQVTSLIDMWRNSTQAKAAPAAAPAPTPKAQISDAARKAAAALAPVSGKRSNVARAPAESFEDAWAEAISQH